MPSASSLAQHSSKPSFPHVALRPFGYAWPRFPNRRWCRCSVMRRLGRNTVANRLALGDGALARSPLAWRGIRGAWPAGFSRTSSAQGMARKSCETRCIKLADCVGGPGSSRTRTPRRTTGCAGHWCSRAHCVGNCPSARWVRRRDRDAAGPKPYRQTQSVGAR